MPRPAMELTGKRFGRLVVLARAPSKKNARWLCRCDCGKKSVVFAHHLASGNSRSCGCLRRETAFAFRRTKFGSLHRDGRVDSPAKQKARDRAAGRGAGQQKRIEAAFAEVFCSSDQPKPSIEGARVIRGGRY